VFGLLYTLLQRKKFDGQIIALYLVGYSAGRVWIEGLRTDSLMLGPIRIAQLISLAFIALGSALYYYQKRRAQA